MIQEADFSKWSWYDDGRVVWSEICTVTCSQSFADIFIVIFLNAFPKSAYLP